MSAEKMRKLFQEWANAHYLLSELNWAIEDGEYEEPEMQYAWEAWQASRAAIEVALPTEEPGYMYYAPDVVSAIESLGLKVKP